VGLASRRKKLSQEVADHILEMIRSQEFPSGSQIPPETELADRFEVSRTAIREAVKALAAINVL
jgi:DNA-binding FadR family transcriptional regulator